MVVDFISLSIEKLLYLYQLILLIDSVIVFLLLIVENLVVKSDQSDFHYLSGYYKAIN